MTKLGRLEKVDLREQWQREDTDFTPWLAAEENIALLGETIGLVLEVQEQEANVGPYRADILCKNLADNSLVLIENQLEKTDHSHLGQLLTYAAGLNAVTLVWVVGSFTEEHRAALDWLNRITGENIHFFGLEVELWKISDSVPAPKFNLAVKPNDWIKTMKEVANSSLARLSNGQQLQFDYWSSFAEFISKCKTSIKAPKPYPSNWMGYGIGRAGAVLTAIINRTEAVVRIETDNVEHPGWFHLLHEQREHIEHELGFSLSWDERPDKKFACVRVDTKIDATNREQWPAIHSWMLEKMEAFRNVFGPKVKKLNDGGWRKAADSVD
jgi:hypothetical protein